MATRSNHRPWSAASWLSRGTSTALALLVSHLDRASRQASVSVTLPRTTSRRSRGDVQTADALRAGNLPVSDLPLLAGGREDDALRQLGRRDDRGAPLSLDPSAGALDPGLVGLDDGRHAAPVETPRYDHDKSFAPRHDETHPPGPWTDSHRDVVQSRPDVSGPVIRGSLVSQADGPSW